MSKQNFSLEAIEAVFNEKNISFPINDFVTAVKQKDKEIKKAEAAIEAAKPDVVDVNENEILPALVGDETVEEVIEAAVDLNSDNYHDLFYDSDGMDDEGADDTLYFKVGDKFYKVEIHCEAEWVGDWSVRKNLPGDISVISVEEILNYKVQEEKKEYITLEIPK